MKKHNKKKIISMFLIAILSISMALTVFGEELTVRDSKLSELTMDKISYNFSKNNSMYDYYILDDGSISILEYKGDSKVTDICIPSKIDGYTVTEIYINVFYACSNLINITIPDTVTRIDARNFDKCKKLYNINVDKNNKIFSSIDGVLFNKEQSILIRVPCGKKGKYIIPNGVKKIDSCAFVECISLTNITIPNSVTEIEHSAFIKCSNLINITIPNSVTKIGNYAFSECSSLTNIIIPNSITEIVMGLFDRCSSLTNIIIPNSITEIDEYAFQKCSNLTNIAIPNSVTRIKNFAFCECSNLISMTIPSSIIEIGNDAFGKCENLHSINVDKNNKKFLSIDGVLYNKEKTELLCFPAGKQGTYTIAKEVENVCDFAFAGCVNLTNVIIPNGVKTIGRLSFAGCSSLTNIVIPNSVKKIFTMAFSECYSLMSITIPDSVTEIESYVFGDDEYIYITICGNAGSYAEQYAKNNKIFFKVLKNSIDKATVSGILDKIYTGKALTQNLAVKLGTKVLKNGTDYTVTYKNNTYLGTATVKITGKGNFIGTVSKTFLIKPKTVTGLKATSYSYNSIKLYWTKQSGVTKYAVYRSTSKTRGYKRIAYVYSNSFINTSLSTGTSYYYKVRAIKTVNKTSYYGKYSSISCAKPVPRKTKVSLTAGRKKMTIRWSKIKGASGYEIYRATSKKGKFIKIRTASYKYFSYTNTHLAAKKTYFYKVRTYRTVKGKRIYSSYSNIVYKKTK